MKSMALMVISLAGAYWCWMDFVGSRMELLKFIGIVSVLMVLAFNFGCFGLTKKLLPVKVYPWVALLLVAIFTVTGLMLWQFG